MRLNRLAVHVLRGLATVLWFFPRWSDARRNAAIHHWSRGLLAIVAVRLRCGHLPRPFPERCLVVLNHVSWLDIFVLDAAHAATFVAKSDIRGWPLAGTLATRAGTLYIDRGSRAALRRTNRIIEAALAQGQLVACFPEGTTTAGDTVRQFHAALLQPALDARAVIQPVALRYLDEQGARTEAPAYVGDDSLLESLWKVLSMQSMTAELSFLPAIRPGQHADRRSIAQKARADITRALDV